ncbi:MAG: CDP-2,3-bis-(O-geranylgeranyl)-sn-glycerol synthase [archaeon]
MVELIFFIIMMSLYLTPLYLANSLACVFGGKTPIDANKKWNKLPLLGKGKTWRGAFSGIFFGSLSGIILWLVLGQEIQAMLGVNYLLFAFMISAGAIIGDLAGSFIKRRFNVARGKPVLFLDQLDFIVGGLIFTLPLRIPLIEEIIFIVVVSLIAHKLGNLIAFITKLKKVPW